MSTGNPQTDAREMARLQRELEEMREELEITTRGTLALYNEIDNQNVQLEGAKKALEEKNAELEQALIDLKSSEEARIKAARTAAIGNIVVTYNHEINNPLAVILASLDLLQEHEQIDMVDLGEHIAKIRRATDRIQEVVAKIKQYENLLPREYLHWDSLDLEGGQEEA